MAIPIFLVDFNEMLEPNLVLLSRGDTREDLNGCPVKLREGLEICVVMGDIDEQRSISNTGINGMDPPPL